MQKFILKPEHIKLLSYANIWWNYTEFGAPGVYPKNPYGGGDPNEDIAEILGIEMLGWEDGEKYPSPDQAKYFQEIHKETEIALQVILSATSLVPGLYEAGKYDKDWRRVEK